MATQPRRKSASAASRFVAAQRSSSIDDPPEPPSANPPEPPSASLPQPEAVESPAPERPPPESPASPNRTQTLIEERRAEIARLRAQLHVLKQPSGRGDGGSVKRAEPTDDFVDTRPTRAEGEEVGELSRVDVPPQGAAPTRRQSGRRCASPSLDASFQDCDTALSGCGSASMGGCLPASVKAPASGPLAFLFTCLSPSAESAVYNETAARRKGGSPQTWSPAVSERSSNGGGAPEAEFV